MSRPKKQPLWVAAGRWETDVGYEQLGKHPDSGVYTTDLYPTPARTRQTFI